MSVETHKKAGGGEREDMVLDSHMQKKEKYLCKFDPRESPINKLAKGRIIFGWGGYDFVEKVLANISELCKYV